MVEQIRPAELARWLAAHAGAVPPLLLDVREPRECAAASIAPEGTELAQWPMATIPERLEELDTERATVVMCHLGGRSQQVAAWLDRQGFTCVANLLGGIDAWSAQVDSAVPRY